MPTRACWRRMPPLPPRLLRLLRMPSPWWRPQAQPKIRLGRRSRRQPLRLRRSRLWCWSPPALGPSTIPLLLCSAGPRHRPLSEPQLPSGRRATTPWHRCTPPLLLWLLLRHPSTRMGTASTSPLLRTAAEPGMHSFCQTQRPILPYPRITAHALAASCGRLIHQSHCFIHLPGCGCLIICTAVVHLFPWPGLIARLFHFCPWTASLAAAQLHDSCAPWPFFVPRSVFSLWPPGAALI